MFEQDPLATFGLIVVVIGMGSLFFLAYQALTLYGASTQTWDLVNKVLELMKDAVLLVLGFYFGRGPKRTKK